MRNICIFFTLLWLSGTARTGTLFAAPLTAPAPRLRIGSATGTPGTQVTVAIALSESGASIVTIAPLLIAFDADVLGVQGCERNPVVSDGKVLSISTAMAGRINLVLAGDLTVLPDGDIIDCTFTISTSTVPGSSTALTFEGAGGSDAGFNDYALVGTDGRVVIAGVSPTPTPAVCGGDCNADARVSVDEILALVSRALGLEQLRACDAGDRDRNGQITIDEILVAVSNALAGCPDVQP